MSAYFKLLNKLFVYLKIYESNYDLSYEFIEIKLNKILIYDIS